jgi:hypothetical protein
MDVTKNKPNLLVAHRNDRRDDVMYVAMIAIAMIAMSCTRLLGVVKSA